jgi:predicted nucleic-acid-binding protein
VIAIDTNVLVRYVVGDDPAQSALAVSLIENELTPERPGFISLVAVAEMSWVLSRVYRAAPEAVRTILRTFLSSPQIAVENPDALERAIARSQNDLADAIIHEVGLWAGCDKTITFDHKFARTPGVELLGGQNAG